MAGSYNHVARKDGSLDTNSGICGLPLLDNGGDVYETIEQMYGMIWWLAGRLAEAPYEYSGLPEDDIKELVEQARKNYEQGLRRSPTKRFV